jgi:hypothetical protein
MELVQVEVGRDLTAVRPLADLSLAAVVERLGRATVRVQAGLGHDDRPFSGDCVKPRRRTSDSFPVITSRRRPHPPL